MRKSISVSEVKDVWEKVPKTEFSDKQRRYFFAVGAMRQGKEDDGYVEVNYSKIPKKSSVKEGADPALIEKMRSLEKILDKVNELDKSIMDFEDKFEQDKKLAKDVINVKRYVEQLISRAENDVKKSGAGLNY